MNRPIDSARACAIARVSRNAAERYGLDSRSAKEVARYGINLYMAGASVGRSISKAIRYARVRSGKALWV